MVGRERDDTRKKICCPFGSSPHPDDCKWRSKKAYVFCGDRDDDTGRSNKCEQGEDKVLSNRWFVDGDGKDSFCYNESQADFCCESDPERDDVCRWNGICSKPGTPQGADCPKGTKSFDGGYAQGICPFMESLETLCCEKSVEPECRWVGDPDKHCEGICDSDEVGFGRHEHGGGKTCQDSEYPHGVFSQDGIMPDDYQNGNVLCCKRDSVRLKRKNLPVPLENLFDQVIGDDEEQDFNIDIDIGSKSEHAHPNANSFGWHIMSGPPDQLQNLNKRDGSHWEVYGCDADKHEGRQSARLVCTKDPGSANCDNILQGGVADTVIEMPPHCGAGKYALAVSLEPMHDADSDASIHPRLMKRLPVGATVYNLTFDYGFHRLQGRADNKVKIRVDYSNAKNYWNRVVGTFMSDGSASGYLCC
jgi:chitinase